MEMANTLAFFNVVTNTAIKGLIVQAPDVQADYGKTKILRIKFYNTSLGTWGLYYKTFYGKLECFLLPFIFTLV